MFCEYATIPDKLSTVYTPDAPCLLDRLVARIGVKHYSPRTEMAYLGCRRFIRVHEKRHSAEMGKLEVEVFLSPGYGEQFERFGADAGAVGLALPLQGGAGA